MLLDSAEHFSDAMLRSTLQTSCCTSRALQKGPCCWESSAILISSDCLTFVSLISTANKNGGL